MCHYQKLNRKIKMENVEVKFLIENSGKWSEITIDSTPYVIKYENKHEDSALPSISCWISDFSSMWLETIEADGIVERLKKCNPLLACNELMNRIISTITTVPKNDSNIQLTGLNNNDSLHLSTKYFLSDGSDQIPLKFYWSLDRGSFRTDFSRMMLLKVIDLERTNSFLIDTIRQKDKELNTKASNNESSQCADKTTSTDFTNEGTENEDDNASVSSDASTDSSKVCHEGITCNNCGEDIFGHRYNCIECEDFDLCMACEHKKAPHSQHILVRYAQPEDKVRSEKLFRLFDKQATQHKAAKRTRFSRN